MEPTSSNQPLITVGDIFRAPGKLVLAGEYAILDGAPAIVLAINRGVECLIEEGSGIETPNGDSRFVNQASALATQYKLTFRDWNPVLGLHGGDKPGFGGSAAACVIATVLSGRPITDAVEIHKRIQGGGSGIDVKASIKGGMFQWNPDTGVTNGSQPLIPVVVWTGTSAKTAPRIQQYFAYDNRSWFVQNSIRFTELFLEDPIGGTRALYRNLLQMSKQANLGYMIPAIEEIVSLAENHGGAAKPSGAGGGDCMVAYFPNREAKQAFVEHIQRHPIYQIIKYQVSNGFHMVNHED